MVLLSIIIVYPFFEYCQLIGVKNTTEHDN